LRDSTVFDKNFLFDGKSIRKEKNTVKEKKRGERHGDKGGLLKKTELSRTGLFKLITVCNVTSRAKI